MRIIAIANQKGGCGKTTVSINVAACLARENQRTLLIDLDPQGHCALGLAVPEEQIEVSIADILAAEDGRLPTDLSRVTWQISSNFDLVPSRTDLSRLERALAGVHDREQRLSRALAPLQDRYDFVVLDTPPHIGFLTESALYAADEVIVPVDTGYFSLHGLSKQMETIRELRMRWGKPLTLRILANHYDVRTKLAREILAELRKRHGDAMFSTFINFNTKLKESSSLGQPITEYDPASSGCRDFVRFARELVSHKPSNGSVSLAPALSSDTLPPLPVQDVRPTMPATLPPLQPSAQPQRTNGPVFITADQAQTNVPAARTAEDRELLARADALAADASKLLATTQTLIGPGRPVAGLSRPQSAPTPMQTARKIERIYGPQPLEDGILFVYSGRGARKVQLAGDFNDWNPDRTPLQHIDEETFQIKLPLAPGRYRYRYVVDGSWRNDPANHQVETNPYGDLNNVVDVAQLVSA